jgi:hypothetical protein
MYFFGETLRRLSKKRFDTYNKTPLKIKFHFLRISLANTLKGPNSWIIFVPVTFLLYVLSTFDLGITSIFYYKTGEIDKFIQNWLGYFIGLFGAVIAVAIFILSGIQSKNQNEEQLSIIFRESLLFPLIYFSLTVMGIMLFISFKPYFMSEEQVMRLTTLGMYLFIGELILIAVLFRRAFQFIDPSFLIKKYYDDLKSKLFAELKRDFISKLSAIIYNEELSQLKLQPNYLYLQSASYSEVSIKLKEKMIVEDAALNDIKKWFYKAPGAIEGSYYLPLAIGQYLSDNSPIFWIKDNNLLAYLKKKQLSNLFVLSKINTAQGEIDKLKLKMKNRLFVFIQSNNLESFYTILDMYNYILIQFAEMYSNFSVFESGVELSSSQVFSPRYSWHILYDMDRDIRNAFILSIDLKNREINKELIDFVFDVYVLAIRKRNLTLVHLFKYLPLQFLRLSDKKEEYDLSSNKYFYMRLKEIIALQATIECEKTDGVDKEKVFAIIMILFDQYVEVMRYLIATEKVNSLIKAWEEFSQCSSLFETFQSKAFTEFPYPQERYPTYYYSGNVFALWAWTILLYKEGKISPESLIKYDKTFAIYNIDLKIILKYYLLQSDEKYFWHDWESEEPKPMKVYWKLSTEDWLLYALILFMFKYHQRNAFTFEDYSQSPDWYYQSSNIITKDILESYDAKWSIFFGKLNKEDLNSLVSKFIQQINEYKEQYNYKKTNEVIEQHVSEKAINNFTKANYDRWIKTEPIYKLFERYGNLQIVSQNEQLIKCYHVYNLIDGKKWFVYEDEYYVQVATEYGFNHNKNEKIRFIREIIKGRNDQNRLFTKIENCLETLISELQQNEIVPNIIICNRLIVLHDRDFRSSPKFKRAPLIGYTNDLGNMDSYDGIPIYYIEDKGMPYVIVARFDQAFKMQLYRPTEDDNSIFQLNVHEFTFQEAKALIEAKDDTWTKDDAHNDLSEEKAIEKILTGVSIEIWTELKFIILDNTMYLIGKVEEDNSKNDNEFDNTY